MIEFNPDEIFEMAEQIERNGAAFYRKAASGAAQAAAGALEKLAAMEDDHLRTFREMRESLADAQKKPVTFDPDDQGAQYLQAMAAGKVFKPSDPSERLTGGESIEQILNTAIGLEKDSIVFYLGLRKLVPERGQAKVDDIIEQEMGHIATLNEELAKVQ